MSSSSEWDDSSEEYYYPSKAEKTSTVTTKPLNAREKFIQKIQSLHKQVITEEPKTTYNKTCTYCGMDITAVDECPCANEFQMWIEGRSMKPWTEPNKMSWKELTNALTNEKMPDLESISEECDDCGEVHLESEYYEVNETSESIESSESTETSECWSEFEWPDVDIKPKMSDSIDVLTIKLGNLNTNYNSLVMERECLITQLQNCEECLESVENERRLVENEINYVDQNITKIIVAGLDEFSQAIQILLGTEEYYDINDLISKYAVKGGSPDSIKAEIIIDAKLYKKQQLMMDDTIEPTPKNKDGLPRLHDSYISDSYTI